MTKDEVFKLAEKFGFIPYKDGIDWSSNYDDELVVLVNALKHPDVPEGWHLECVPDTERWE